jgi:hypothetical protein
MKISSMIKEHFKLEKFRFSVTQGLKWQRMLFDLGRTNLFTNVFVLFLIFRQFLNVDLNSNISGTNVTWLDQPEEIRAEYGEGDQGNFLSVALTLSRFQNIDYDTQSWIVRLWPPGMPLIEVPLVWLDKIGIPISISMLILTSLLWFSVIQKLVKFCRDSWVGSLICYSSLAIYSFTWDFAFLFTEGLFNSEGLGYGCMLLGFLICTELVFEESPKLRKTIIAGLLFGVGAYIRQLAYLPLIIGSCILLIALFFRKIKSSSSTKVDFQANKTFNSLFIPFMVGLLLTFPWTLMIGPTFYGVKPGQMSDTSSYLARDIWTSPESEHAKYWAGTNNNWACVLDLEKCNEIIQEQKIRELTAIKLYLEAAMSVFKDPLTYIEIRSRYGISNWLPKAYDSSIGRAMGYFLLLIFCLSPFFLFQVWRKTQSRSLLFLWALPLTCLTLAQSIALFQPRYFIPIRLLALVVFLIWIRVEFDKGYEVNRKIKSTI